MGELELVGLHEDGEHLVLVAPDGARFRVRIDEPLRAAVRRDRPQLEQLRAESAGTLSPREIQARIRAGATTQEVADSAGLPVERVRRYEGPVLAEREHVAEQARGTRVGRDVGAPTLGDLVTDRLAARGVDPGSLAWDAARDDVRAVGGPRAVRGGRRRARGAVDLRPGQAHRRRRRGRGPVAVGDRAARRARLAPPPRRRAGRRVRLPGRRHAAHPAGRPGRRARARARPARGDRVPAGRPAQPARGAAGRRARRRRLRGVRGLRTAARVRLRTARHVRARRPSRRRRPCGRGPGLRRPRSPCRSRSAPRQRSTTTPSDRGRAVVAPRCRAGTRSSSARSPNERPHVPVTG